MGKRAASAGAVPMLLVRIGCHAVAYADPLRVGAPRLYPAGTLDDVEQLAAPWECQWFRTPVSKRTTATVLESGCDGPRSGRMSAFPVKWAASKGLRSRSAWARRVIFIPQPYAAVRSPRLAR